MSLGTTGKTQPDLSARPGSGTTVLINSQSSPPAEDGSFGDATCKRHPWAYTGELAQNHLPFALTEVWTNKETTTINENFLILFFFGSFEGKEARGTVLVTAPQLMKPTAVDNTSVNSPS